MNQVMESDKNLMIKKFDLKPLEPEGGYFTRTYLSNAGHGNTILYLVDRDSFSQMHRLQCDEVFHFYSGDAVEMLLLHPFGEAQTLTLGNDLLGSEVCQTLVPAGTWQGVKLKEGGNWALLGTSCFPAFDFNQFELGDPKILSLKYPSRSELIQSYFRK